MPDVRMPDGRIIRNVPEGTTKAELTAKLQRNGLLGEGSKQGTEDKQGAIRLDPIEVKPEQNINLDSMSAGVLGDLENSPFVRRLEEFGSGITRGAAKMADLPGHLALMTVGKDVDKGFFEAGAEQLGLTAPPADRAGQFVQRVGEEVGANVLPSAAMLRAAKGARAAFDVGRGASVGGALKNALREGVESAGRNPGRFAAGDAGVAAVSGLGAAGAEQAFPGNETAEMVGQSLPLTPAIGASAIRGALRGGEAGRQGVERTIEAFRAAGTTPTAGQATGGKMTQGFENLLTNIPGGARIAQKAAEVDEEIGNRVRQMVGDLSTRATAEDAGRAIERGIRGAGGFADRFRATATKLYEKFDELIPAGLRVDVSATQSALRELSDPIRGAEAVSGVLSNPVIVRFAEAVKSSAGDGVLPYEALKDMRTAIGRRLASTQVLDDVPRAELKRLYGAISEDMQKAAAAGGKEALQAFERANSYYRAGSKRVDDVLNRVSRSADPAQIFKTATRGREGGFTVRSTMRSLKNDERRVVTAAVLDRMGMASPGNQDEIGETFSPETFLTNWNRLSGEAKKALFDWKEFNGLRENLDKIAKATATLRESRRAARNPSGTGQVLGKLTSYGLFAGGLLNSNLGMASVGAAGMGGAAIASRLLTSPDFVSWLARSTEIPAQRIPQHLSRLSLVAQDAAPEVQEAIQAYAQQFREIAESEPVEQ